MKDNPARFAWACLLLCWLPWRAAGQRLQVLQFANGVQYGFQTAAKPEPMPEPRGDVLEFVDGSGLHGTLASMDLQHGLSWSMPEASQPIRFRPDHLDFIRFAGAQTVKLAPTCHLWFGNGDDLYGSISSMDDKQLGFNTWFGGTMVLPRAAVRAITLLPPHYSVAYEGPYDTGGWVVVNNSPKSWTFQDGAFIGAGAGTLGRELHLTNSTTVEFDLAWNTFFTLEVGVYCDVSDQLGFTGGSCVVNLTPTKITLTQPQNNNRGMFLGVSSVTVPSAETNGAMHVAIECDKEEGTASVFIDHVLAKTWKDFNFAGGGTGVLFMQRAMFANTTFKLSGLKITQWEGRSEPLTSLPPSSSDSLYFVNHDQAAGKIESIQDGRVRLALSGTVLDIPLERVTQMDFAQTQVPAEQPGPWLVRAHFPGGGSLSFQLEKWNDKEIVARSALFGSLAFQPDSIREMEFNLNRPKHEGMVAESKEYEELDE